ncbi:MAG: 50S ribosomal protein L17 [Planctomycetota bacterium]|nr:MAG: 50S ribosomal protein L17 [Planctomycetota bacterium]
MRHRKRGRRLGRTGAHRKALMRNLTIALFEHGKIKTTVPKAKEVTPFAHRLITLARKGTLHHRRQAASLLPNKAAVKKLFDEIAPQFAARNGGYTRIIRLPQKRLGDAAETCYLELIGDTAPVLGKRKGWARNQRRNKRKFRSDEDREPKPAAAEETPPEEEAPVETEPAPEAVTEPAAEAASTEEAKPEEEKPEEKKAPEEPPEEKPEEEGEKAE